MKKFFIGAFLGLCSISGYAWSQKGHDVTAYIAEKHLTPAAAAAVDSILDGMSMVYWANWLDNASHTLQYAYTKTWHYKNIDEGERYEEAQANPAGDITTAVKAQLETLADKSATAEQHNLAMKILVHLMGDMHQPMHLGRAKDLGGNRIKVKFFGNDKNLHSVWDSSLPEYAHKWSYSEWQEQIDRLSPEKQEAEIAGWIDDWAKETMKAASDVYRLTPSGSPMSYDAVAYWTPTVEKQFLRGGLRLAHLLNMLYDPTYAASHRK